MRNLNVPKDCCPPVGVPYSKKYMEFPDRGGSPIPGARFETVVVHPMMANSKPGPRQNVTFPSSWHIWEASPDCLFLPAGWSWSGRTGFMRMSYFYRIDDHTRLIPDGIRGIITGMEQNCVLNLLYGNGFPGSRR